MVDSLAGSEQDSFLVWWDIKYWRWPVLTIYLGLILNAFVPFSGVFIKVKQVNINSCEKIQGQQDFRYCEDFVLADGIAYVACNPGFVQRDRQNQGGLWKVDYNQSPATVDKLLIDHDDTFTNFYPLGIKLDIHPVTGEKTLVAINLDGSKPSIELFSVKPDRLVHKRTIRDDKIYTPNSLHVISDVRFRDTDGTPSFYFTNDHYFTYEILKMVENFMVHWSNVGFYNARTGRIQKGVDGFSFANGLAGTDTMLFVSDTYRRTIKQYEIKITATNKPHIQLNYVTEAKFDMAVDNIEYYPDKDLVVAAGHPHPLSFVRYLATQDESVMTPSQVNLWHVNSGDIKLLMQDDGSHYRASTKGAIDFNQASLVVSSILEDGLLVCKLK